MNKKEIVKYVIKNTEPNEVRDYFGDDIEDFSDSDLMKWYEEWLNEPDNELYLRSKAKQILAWQLAEEEYDRLSEKDLMRFVIQTFHNNYIEWDFEELLNLAEDMGIFEGGDE